MTLAVTLAVGFAVAALRWPAALPFCRVDRDMRRRVGRILGLTLILLSALAIPRSSRADDQCSLRKAYVCKPQRQELGMVRRGPLSRGLEGVCRMVTGITQGRQGKLPRERSSPRRYGGEESLPWRRAHCRRLAP
jgi:hypothetical protein